MKLKIIFCLFALSFVSCKNEINEVEPKVQIDSIQNNGTKIGSKKTFSVEKEKFEKDKKETIDWLNSKFGENVQVIRPTKNSSLYTRLKIDYDGNFTVTHYSELNNQNDELIQKDISTFSGNFKNLSLSSFNVREVENNTFVSKKCYYIFMSCLSDYCITQTSYKNFTQIEQNQVDNIFHNKEVLLCYITDNMDYGLVERSKNAFIHLTELFGGKEEKF